VTQASETRRMADTLKGTTIQDIPATAINECDSTEDREVGGDAVADAKVEKVYK
jgi:hypothetical protein